MATTSVPSDASSVSVCSAATALPLSPLPLLPAESEQSNSLTSEPDCSIEDVKERQAVDDFIARGCSCTLGKLGTSCSKQLSRSLIDSTRQDCLDLTRNELDLIILSQIHSHQNIDDVGSTSHHTARSTFYIHGLQLCLTTYLYVHCISRKRYQNLVKQYHEHGLSPRVHGNTKPLPTNSLSTEDRDYLKTFVTNYARAHGIPLPGRIPGHRNKVILLPTDITKVFVHSKYKEACSERGFRPAGKSSFYQLWQDVLPHISVSTPSTDLCRVPEK